MNAYSTGDSGTGHTSTSESRSLPYKVPCLQPQFQHSATAIAHVTSPSSVSIWRLSTQPFTTWRSTACDVGCPLHLWLLIHNNPKLTTCFLKKHLHELLQEPVRETLEPHLRETARSSGILSLSQGHNIKGRNSCFWLRIAALKLLIISTTSIEYLLSSNYMLNVSICNFTPLLVSLSIALMKTSRLSLWTFSL